MSFQPLEPANQNKRETPVEILKNPWVFQKSEQRSKPWNDIPLNPGWLIGILISWLIINPYMGVSKNSGTPKWMVKIMENPMNKWMILETPII